MKADDFSRCGYGATDGSASQQLINTDLGGMACRTDRAVSCNRSLARFYIGNSEVTKGVDGYTIRCSGKSQAKV